jgi:hypothetical protein
MFTSKKSCYNLCNMKKIIEHIKVILLALILVAGAGYAKAWTGASQAAPNGNTPPPLNVGSAVQTKLGSLIINAAAPIQNAIGLTVFGTSTFNGAITVADGTQGTGKILTSDANGNAHWAMGGGASGSGPLWSSAQYISNSQSASPYVYTFTHNLGTSNYLVHIWLDYTTPSSGTPTKNGALLVSQAAFTDGSNNTDNTLSSGVTIKTTNNTVEVRTPAFGGTRPINCITGSWTSSATTQSNGLSYYFDCKKSGWLIVDVIGEAPAAAGTIIPSVSGGGSTGPQAGSVGGGCALSGNAHGGIQTNVWGNVTGTCRLNGGVLEAPTCASGYTARESGASGDGSSFAPSGWLCIKN